MKLGSIRRPPVRFLLFSVDILEQRPPAKDSLRTSPSPIESPPCDRGLLIEPEQRYRQLSAVPEAQGCLSETLAESVAVRRPNRPPRALRADEGPTLLEQNEPDWMHTHRKRRKKTTCRNTGAAFRSVWIAGAFPTSFHVAPLRPRPKPVPSASTEHLLTRIHVRTAMANRHETRETLF